MSTIKPFESQHVTIGRRSQISMIFSCFERRVKDLSRGFVRI
jgi:hypothetical protein